MCQVTVLIMDFVKFLRREEIRVAIRQALGLAFFCHVFQYVFVMAVEDCYSNYWPTQKSLSMYFCVHALLFFHSQCQ